MTKKPERSFEKKNNSKKGCIPGDKMFRPIFTRIIEYDERQAKKFLGSGMFVDNFCGSYKIISGTLKRLLKIQSFGIKAILPVNKILWPFYIVLLIMTNDREHFKRVQIYFDKYCASYKIIPVRPKRSIEKLFKKDPFFCEKKICPLFSSTTEKNRPQGTIYTGPQGFFDKDCAS